VGLASIAVAVCCWSVPAVLLGGNREDLVEPFDFYKYFFIGGWAALALLAVTFRFLNPRNRVRVAAVLAAYGLSVYFFDVFLGLDIGPIENGNETLKFQALGSLAQVAVFFFLVRGLLKIDIHKTGVVGAVFSLVFTLMSLPNLLSFKSSAPEKTEAPTPNPSVSGAPDFNIYHIVFDAYYGPWLQWALKESEIAESSLKDFTHFRRARSNFPETVPSFVSFMTGTLFDGKRPLSEWYGTARTESLIPELKQLGFTTHVQAVSRRAPFESADEVIVAQSPPLRLLADYWLLRVAPVALRSVILKNGAGPFSRVGQKKGSSKGDVRTYASYLQFKKVVEKVLPTAPESGHYFHFYFNPPHGPFEMDRHGRFTGKSTYSEQLFLATGMLKTLVDKIQSKKAYEKSLIIIHSDHGSPSGAEFFGSRDPLKDLVRMDSESSAAIEKVDLLFKSGRSTDARFSPLLLIKWPIHCSQGQRRPPTLVVRDDLVQLLDMRTFVRKNLKAWHKPGSDCGYPVSNEVNVFNGLVTQLTKRGTARKGVGTDIKSGFYNHYLTYPDGHWKVRELQPFVY
jgi:hypothetical protein